MADGRESEYCMERSHLQKNRRAIGSEYERLAAAYLKQNGYEILEQNYRCRAGEIDLIARDGSYLVFVEVKYRKNSQKGFGSEAVDRRKQQRIIRAARWYLAGHRQESDILCRFDVVSFCKEQICLLKDAFWCEGRNGF